MFALSSLISFKRLQIIERGLTRLANGLCLIGGLGLAAAVLVTGLSALGKLGARTLGALLGADQVPAALAWIKPLGGEKELLAFAVGFALFAALPLVTLKRGHIRIDLLQPLFGGRLNALLTLIADALLLALAVVFVRQHWNAIFRPARNNSRVQEETLAELFIAGDWATVWGERFLNAQQTQVAGLKFWPWHVWAEACALVFLAVAALLCLQSIFLLFTPPKTAAREAGT